MLSQTEASRDLGLVPLPAFTAAWDCHVHVFGPRDRYPLQPASRYLPAPVTADDLQVHMARVGARSVVLVQASPYGTDNSCLLDRLLALGKEHRAVVSLLPNMISDRRITQLSAAGIRGVRINPGKSAWGSDTLTLCVNLSEQLSGTGWHLEVNCSPDTGRRLARVCSNRTPLVFDHLAGIDPAHPDFESHVAAIGEILADRNWIKISGLDRVRRCERDGERLTQTISLTRHFARDRIIWGSDWPHTPIEDGDAPFRQIDMNVELSWILGRLGEDAERIMCINPDRLYR
jgi:2-pyrone-4,6-dicarboxylate lactonase